MLVYSLTPLNSSSPMWWKKSLKAHTPSLPSAVESSIFPPLLSWHSFGRAIAFNLPICIWRAGLTQQGYLSISFSKKKPRLIAANLSILLGINRPCNRGYFADTFPLYRLLKGLTSSVVRWGSRLLTPGQKSALGPPLKGYFGDCKSAHPVFRSDW